MRRPAAVSKIAGVNVRGFKHAISNQAVAHIRSRHPNIGAADIQRLPAIVKTGKVKLGKDRGVNGVARLVYRATVDDVKYEYIGEVRRKKQRIDAITLYRL